MLSPFLFHLLSGFALLASVQGSCEKLEAKFSSFSQSLRNNSDVQTLTINATCEKPYCAKERNTLRQGAQDISLLTLQFTPGRHVFHDGLPIHNSQYISLIGKLGDDEDVTSPVVQCGQPNQCDYDAYRLNHIDIRNSSNVYIAGITFSWCYPLVAAVHVQNSTYVVFENCTFQRYYNGSAVHLINSHHVVFRNCTFERKFHQPQPNWSYPPSCYQNLSSNIFFSNSQAAAGALSVFFSTENQSLHLLITDCTFKDNIANLTHKTHPRALQPFGHGGAITLRLVGMSDSSICIKDSQFINNTAEANGGAIQLSMVNNAVSNTVIIRNCRFVENKCPLDTCTGGVIGIDFHQNEAFNEVHFIDSNFTKNSADAGGVVSLVTSISIHQNDDGWMKPLLFKNCLFEGNMARSDGAVVSVFSSTTVIELGFPLYFEDCHFNNSNVGQQLNTSAFSGYQVVANFNGTNLFTNNIGGGVVVSESRVNVKGNLSFKGNVAVNGGGLAMFGRCLLVLFEQSQLEFINNHAQWNGGGIYAEFTARGFLFNILNRGCFLQYYSDDDDVPLCDWTSQVSFTNNSAGRAGAAVFASDFTLCMWYGNTNDIAYPDQTFFIPVNGCAHDGYPFQYSHNTINGISDDNVTNIALATAPHKINVIPELLSDDNKNVNYSYGELATFNLTMLDQFGNFREGVFVTQGIHITHPVGTVSSKNTPHVYKIPSKQELDNKSNVHYKFKVRSPSSLLDTTDVSITIKKCHPGYTLSQLQQTCECCRIRHIVRCDTTNRYFYVQEGYYVYVENNNFSCQGVSFQVAIPGFLDCTNHGNLTGCLFKFDHIDSQCVSGRNGLLCSNCTEGYSVSLDLQKCLENSYCGSWGVAVFVVVCVSTVILSLLVLFFDIKIPNSLKGVIFFAQVIGVIYRNSYYLGQDENLQFLVNLFGVSLPIPICLHINAPPILVAWLGIVPPLLAIITAAIYIICAGRIKLLSKRSTGLHGFQIICLFVYKYFLDTGFTLSNCRIIGNQWVFAFSGETCYTPHIMFSFIAGMVIIIAFAFVIPVVFLVYIYKPQKHLHLHDAFTRGIKEKRRYLWYGVWDIWRRVLFLIAANLLYSPASVVVVVDAFLVLLVLTVHCAVKPYKHSYINATEALILFCLFGATIAILDEHDIYIGKPVSVFFIVAPFVYGVVILVYKLLILKLCLRKNMTKYKLTQMLSKSIERAQRQLHWPKEEITAEWHSTQATSMDPWSVQFREPLIDEAM